MSEPREERLERIAANLMELYLYPERWGNENLRTLHLKVIEEAHFEIKRLAQIERQVRELADEAQQIGDEPSTAQGDAPELARLQVHRHYARKLRAIINPPEDT